MKRLVPFCALFLLLTALRALGATPTPAQVPTGTPTEAETGGYCGDGRREPHYEDCDDGNLFNGDGCSSSCEVESIRAFGFEPIDRLVAAAHTSVFTRGTIVLAKPRGNLAVVKEFSLEPTGVPQAGILCVRAVVPPDGRFGPDNVGTGEFARQPGSYNIFSATLFIEEWLNQGLWPDLGADGLPCTEDDPAFPMATTKEEKLNLAIYYFPCVGDGTGDGTVSVDELIKAVNNSLTGCPSPQAP